MCDKSEVFSTLLPGQSAIHVKVYQGEHQVASQNVLLGDFMVEDLQPNRPDGLSDVVVNFQANALRADYGSCSTYSMVSPLHPGHPSVGIPPRYSPRNLAAPIATSMMASLTHISSPQTGQR
jgi:Hsp70 protein